MYIYIYLYPVQNLGHTCIKNNLFVVYLKFTLNQASCVLPDNCTWAALEDTSVWVPHQDAGFQVALTVFQKSQMILISQESWSTDWKKNNRRKNQFRIAADTCLYCGNPSRVFKVPMCNFKGGFGVALDNFQCFASAK